MILKTVHGWAPFRQTVADGVISSRAAKNELISFSITSPTRQSIKAARCSGNFLTNAPKLNSFVIKGKDQTTDNLDASRQWGHKLPEFFAGQIVC